MRRRVAQLEAHLQRGAATTGRRIGAPHGQRARRRLLPQRANPNPNPNPNPNRNPTLTLTLTLTLQLLLGAGRAPEAAFLARTYLPSRQSDMVQLWREALKAVNPKAAESIADPMDYPNLFEGLDYALKV